MKYLLAIILLLAGCAYAYDPVGDGLAEEYVPIAVADFPAGLTRQDFRGRVDRSVRVPNSVLTVGDTSLVVYYWHTSPGDYVEFGTNQILQIYIDGGWYSFPHAITRDEPLLMRPVVPSVLTEEGAWEEWDDWVRHEVDLSFFGELPSGRYRLVERLYNPRMQLEFYLLSFFWVIEPGQPFPSHASTEGGAYDGDMSLAVQSMHEARRQVTDECTRLMMLFTNHSGREYVADHRYGNAVLERYESGEWYRVPFFHANLGLVFGWETSATELFLSEGQSLVPGSYRLTVRMHRIRGTIQTRDEYIKPAYYFTVYAASELPPPAWDSTQLVRTIFIPSEEVTMTPVRPYVSADFPTLELVLSAERTWMYGMPFRIQVQLDGYWYNVPFSAFFIMPAFEIGPNTPLEFRTIERHILGTVGLLPPGQYRIVKEFTVWGGQSPTPGGGIVIEHRIYAAAEFEVR